MIERRIAHALRHGGSGSRANALELLANLLPGAIEFPVVAALEGTPGTHAGMAAAGALEELSAHPRPWLSATALHAAATLRAGPIEVGG